MNHLAIKCLLKSENNDWGNRVLVPYYLHQADTGQAQITLARIPNSTPLHDILTMLVVGVNNNHETNLQHLSTNQDAYIAAFAESMLALYFDKQYVRGVNLGGQSSKRSEKLITGNRIEVNEDISLVMYPNPTKDYLQLVFNRNIQDVKANIHIYDLKGKKVFQAFLQQENEIDLRTLNVGTYFCKVSLVGVGTITEKLIIIR
ncbi:MAG: T9SS type A sorting domain-containing protein [Chitinophagales bacterium]